MLVIADAWQALENAQVLSPEKAIAEAVDRVAPQIGLQLRDSLARVLAVVGGGQVFAGRLRAGTD
jgi:hypoxanthine-guanine phosphoribosyltransferase